MDLSNEEIKKIGILLASDNQDNMLLGYELIKKNRKHIHTVEHELRLISIYNEDKAFRNRVKRYVQKHCGKDEAWMKGLEMFELLGRGYKIEMTVEMQKSIDEHEKMRPVYQPIFTQNRTYAQKYYKVAQTLHYRIKTEFELVAAYYNIVLKADPTHANALFGLAHLYQTEYFDFEQSEALYLRLFTIAPKMDMAYNNMGALYATQREGPDKEKYWEKSLEYHQKALALSPNYSFYKCNVAGAYLRLQNYAEFERLVAEILKKDPKNSRVMNQWANYLWEHLKRYEEAEATYKKALKWYPKDPFLLGNLGEFYAYIYQRYDETFIYYKKSLKQRATIYRLVMMVILLVKHLNRPEEAVTYYKELIHRSKKTKRGCRHPHLEDDQWAEFLEVEAKLKSLNLIPK